MDFELKDVLDAVGPTASLIFAAWIFLSFLQQRYVAAYENYRKLIAEYRGLGGSHERRASLGEQIVQYKARCELMRKATNVGVCAAILLIMALVAGALHVMFELQLLKYASAAFALLGLLTVAAAAVFVLRENTGIRATMDSDLSDLHDLAQKPIGPGGPAALRTGNMP
jgi:hypothetical protein